MDAEVLAHRHGDIDLLLNLVFHSYTLIHTMITVRFIVNILPFHIDLMYHADLMPNTHTTLEINLAFPPVRVAVALAVVPHGVGARYSILLKHAKDRIREF